MILQGDDVFWLKQYFFSGKMECQCFCAAEEHGVHSAPGTVLSWEKLVSAGWNRNCSIRFEKAASSSGLAKSLCAYWELQSRRGRRRRRGLLGKNTIAGNLTKTYFRFRNWMGGSFYQLWLFEDTDKMNERGAEIIRSEIWQSECFFRPVFLQAQQWISPGITCFEGKLQGYH